MNYLFIFLIGSLSAYPQNYSEGDEFPEIPASAVENEESPSRTVTDEQRGPAMEAQDEYAPELDKNASDPFDSYEEENMEED